MPEVSFDPSLEMTSKDTKDVRLDVINEQDTPSSSRGSSNSSLSESILVPGSMPSSFQVESPRKVPKRQKKRSVHFSQLEKTKKPSSGFNRTSWILLGFNLIQVVALIVLVLHYSGDNASTERICVGGGGNGNSNEGEGEKGGIGSIDSKGMFMVASINTYLDDISSPSGGNFTTNFGKSGKQPMQTKITPPWDLQYFKDSEVQDYFGSLAPNADEQQVFLGIDSSQVLAVYQKRMNLTLTSSTLCYFTNYAVGTVTPVSEEFKQANAEARDYMLSTVQHFEQEGFCTNSLQPEGNGGILSRIGPYVQSTIAKTYRHPCTSFEEFRVAIVQDLLGIMEAKARETFSTKDEEAVMDHCTQFFAEDVEGYVRDATGDYMMLKSRAALMPVLLERPFFVALEHKVLAQNFDVSVVSQMQVTGPEGKQEWYDTSFFQFSGEKDWPPKITKVYFSFHN
ncbi:hypothetical protein HOP50_19g84880 [Chloropicon primus]|uniref:Uncharacterized protein n=1 Tax=Chloropicon primus TaxID=1764295 RepID=A0A5B8MZL5_9CHLO|nr:hypothetical protein A3770_19p84570 [Chloropicon primus]UPR05140.1 hypothetical protein HOP50_19g84880 [Chloropicon primus]|eukprot:QDZ25939.1 hypothetical protein A3770_19p84570 [Chloropicon primus]